MSDVNASRSQATIKRLRQSFKSVFLVLIAYILSFGPAYSTTYAFFGLSGCEPVLKIYAPVIWLSEFTILETALGFYMMMWLWFWGSIVTY
ncbi:MAG TPA: hypothetical protein DCM07_29770 [Planctomycetaceae bacterium]|nr:hypothetical protein [Gimesia sp.]HAH48956.1 hypothetical protein [Planctomycetaceae bacterium]